MQLQRASVSNGAVTTAKISDHEQSVLTKTQVIPLLLAKIGGDAVTSELVSDIVAN